MDKAELAKLALDQAPGAWEKMAQELGERHPPEYVELDRRDKLLAILASPSLQQKYPKLYEEAKRYISTGSPDSAMTGMAQGTGVATALPAQSFYPDPVNVDNQGQMAGTPTPLAAQPFYPDTTNVDNLTPMQQGPGDPAEGEGGATKTMQLRPLRTGYMPPPNPPTPVPLTGLDDLDFEGGEGGAGIEPTFGSESTYLREQAAARRQQADAEQALELAKGHKEGYYQKQVKAWTEYATARGELSRSRDDDIKDLKLGAQYPGILGGAEEIKDLRLKVDRAKDLMQNPDQPMSKEEADQIMAEGSEAHARLTSGQQIDQFRAFGGIGSKILAIGAMGASALGTGDNTAYKLIAKTIENDIESQQDLFRRVGARVGERQSEYEQALATLKDERAAKLMAESMAWGRASSQLKAQIALTKGEGAAAGLEALAARALEAEDAAAEEAKQAAIDAEVKVREREAKIKKMDIWGKHKLGTLAVSIKKEARKTGEGLLKAANDVNKLELGWSQLDGLNKYRESSLALKKEIAVLKHKYDAEKLALQLDNQHLSEQEFEYSKVKEALDNKYREAELELKRDEAKRKGSEFKATHGLAVDKHGADAAYRGARLEFEKDVQEDLVEHREDKLEFGKDKFEATEDRAAAEFKAGQVLQRELAALKDKQNDKILALRTRHANLSDEEFALTKEKVALDKQFRTEDQALRRQLGEQKGAQAERGMDIKETGQDRSAEQFERTAAQRDRKLGLSEKQIDANIKHRKDALAFDEEKWSNLSARDAASHAMAQGRLTLEEKKHLDHQANRRQLTLKESLFVEMKREEMATDKEQFASRQEMKREEYADRAAREEKKAARDFAARVRKNSDEDRKHDVRVKKLAVLQKKADDQKTEKDRRWAHITQLYNTKLRNQEGSVHMPGWEFTGTDAEKMSRQPGISEKVRDRNAAANDLFASVERALEFVDREGALFPVLDWDKTPQANQLSKDLANKLRIAYGFGVIAHKFELERLEKLAGDIGSIWESGVKASVTVKDPIILSLEKLLSIHQASHSKWMKDYGYKKDYSGTGAPITFHSPKVPEGPRTSAEEGEVTSPYTETTDTDTDADENWFQEKKEQVE